MENTCSTACGSGECLVSCPAQAYRPGSRVVRLSAEAIAKLREFVERPREVGGTLEPRLDRGTLELATHSAGDKDSVSIPLGTFQFHTHPNACTSRKACYFEFPSENDMALIARDCMRGVQAHFVFSRNRTYRVGLTSRLRAAFARRPELVDRVFDDFAGLMNRLQETASQHGTGVMDALMEDWLGTARSYGFSVEVFSSPAKLRERLLAA